MNCKSKKSVMKIAAHPTWERAEWMGGRASECWRAALGTGSSSHQPWNLVVLDGLVAAGTPPRQSRPFLVFCKYRTVLQKCQPVQFKCDLA